MKFYTCFIVLIIFQIQSCSPSNDNEFAMIKDAESSQPVNDDNQCQFYYNDKDLKSIKKPTIIYIVYPDTWEEKGVLVATPLVIYKNEKYYSPHFCESQDSLGCDLNKMFDSLLLEEPLYLLNPNKTSKVFYFYETSEYGLSSWTRPSAKIENVAADNLLTNNIDLVINKVKIIPPNDRPFIPKRKRDYDDGFYEDYLIGQVDINMDGIPELIYCSQSYEGVFYQIYSKDKKFWRLVYGGSYNGV